MNVEEALDNYTHAIATGAEFGEVQVAFINLKVAHKKYAAGLYMAEVGDGSLIAEGGCNVD